MDDTTHQSCICLPCGPRPSITHNIRHFHRGVNSCYFVVKSHKNPSFFLPFLSFWRFEYLFYQIYRLADTWHVRRGRKLARARVCFCFILSLCVWIWQAIGHRPSVYIVYIWNYFAFMKSLFTNILRRESCRLIQYSTNI